MSLSTANRCLQDLVALGLVKIKKVSVDGKLHNTYFLQLGHFVYWDRKAQPNFKKFVQEEQRQKQEKLRQPDETKEEYVQRLLRGSFIGKADQAGGRK